MEQMYAKICINFYIKDTRTQYVCWDGTGRKYFHLPKKMHFFFFVFVFFLRMVLWLQEFILTQLCKQDVVQHNKLSLCFRRKKEKVTAVNKARSFSHNFPFRPNVLTWKMSRYHLWSSTLNAGNEPASWNSLKEQ